MTQEEANKYFKGRLEGISSEIKCSQYSIYFYNDEGHYVSKDRVLKINHSEKELEDFIGTLVDDLSTYGLSGFEIIHLKNYGYWVEITQERSEEGILYPNMIIRTIPTVPVECLG